MKHVYYYDPDFRKQKAKKTKSKEDNFKDEFACDEEYDKKN